MLPHIRRIAETLQDAVQDLEGAAVEKAGNGWILSVDGDRFFAYRPQIEFLELDLWLEDEPREDLLMLPFVTASETGGPRAVTVRIENSEDLRLSLEWIYLAYNSARNRTQPGSSAVS